MRSAGELAWFFPDAAGVMMQDIYGFANYVLPSVSNWEEAHVADTWKAWFESDKMAVPLEGH